ncbi:MAG: DUF3618 domain-containing protein [Microlunatus sp.]|nr:DUF3618 domain-containing protein [Microlunatus sp.]MDN5770971.1 DUF3618 domain-containing protein [Microlunatus sp.]
MTTSNDPDQIRADIERTRAELSDNVDSLADTANPKNIADRQVDMVKDAARGQVDKVKDAARGMKEKVMGSPDDPYDYGRSGNAKAQVSQRASEVGDAVSGAPGRAKEKARGNPLAAGLIAFGAGLLVSSLIPASQKEQRAVSDLQQNLEPLKQRAGDAAKEMADNLRGPAQEAAESVKSTATGAAQNVKDEGQSAKEQVQGQAEQSKSTVQDSRSS